MKQVIKINRNSGLAYISEDIRREGYVDDVECLPNAITLTLIRPGSSLADVKSSLQNVLKDLDLRMKYEDKDLENLEGNLTKEKLK